MFAATIRKNCGVMLIIGGAEVTMEVDSKKRNPTGAILWGLSSPLDPYEDPIVSNNNYW